MGSRTTSKSKTTTTTAPSLQHGVELRRVEDLRPYARNARTHSKKQVRQIASSIQEFGFNNPVLISDEHEIIAGHGHVEAAKLLGLQQVPTLRLSHLSPAQRRAYVLADNKLALNAGWNQDLLAGELKALQELEFSLELTAFSTAEIDLAFEAAGEKAPEPPGPEDAVVEPGDEPAVTREGDLWRLGPHRLLCGDALALESYAALLQGDLADLVFTDPPYNVPIEGHVSGLGATKHRDFAMASGEMNEAEFTAFLARFLDLARAHSRDGSIHYVCMDAAHALELLTAVRQVGLSLKTTCVWAKSNGGMGSLYRQQCEFVHVLKNGEAPHVNNVELGRHGRNRTTLWQYAGVNSFRRGRMEELSLHPTVKPVALVADAIKDCSKRRGVVLDPFSGSGTTLVAAEKTGRVARVLELSPAYCDVAIRRWQAQTGRQAVLSATGQIFEEVEAERLPEVAEQPTHLRSAA
ncbi:site-specific DNA-methyltransferase [Methylobacterium nodulans]|uniref:Methyltransferase n=1 Tax=Methylobacterium nodulans (strain LMG 21967 / CNCM I-2342 / ORS 2060) TaxID=460265 RepID=B8IGK2_METNO|nr:DNA methyltransferase [Methylobacterium nodulans]ACL55902.1 DNA methylase N-4/N-6 domain protein [Methylobacterium nodulans ORS 2060]